MTGEFELIDHIRQMAADAHEGVVLGIGDDGAVLRPLAGHDLVATADTLNAGVHFTAETSAADIGHKALAVNLSDLAAMGATPRWALLSVSLSAEDSAWLNGFVGGFLSLAGDFGLALVGGDTCAGDLSLAVTALGEVPAGKALTRGGAKPGDLVVVSGCLGDAALALADRSAGTIPGEFQSLALDRPIPRVALGVSLIGKATSCIDISDGLLADLGHIAKASGCGSEIELSLLPTSESLSQREDRQRWNLQLAGGDDYELCFTISPGLEDQLTAMSERLDVPLTVIGKMVEASGVRCMAPDGGVFQPTRSGYEHFK